MATDTDRLLASALGQAKVTRQLRLAAGALDEVAAAAAEHLPGRPLLVCADHDTWRAAGARVLDVLEVAGREAEPLILEGEPRLKPDTAISRRIAASLAETGAAPIAVGSGVLNDLAKCAAGFARTPYLCVPTAASMDGYAASGAAMIEEGFKRTIDCPPPVAIVADTRVIGDAPAAMAAWGYGDLAGKLTAGADWMLADALGEEALDRPSFDLVQDHLEGWLDDPSGVAEGEAGAIRDLVGGLMIAGFAMQAYGNSRPASGSDHQFSHLWEMEHLTVAGQPAAHGACVGVGCVAVLALYGWLLRRDLSGIDVEACLAGRPNDAALAAEADAVFPAGPLREAVRAEALGKRDAPAERRARLERLKRAWPDLRRRLAARLPAPGEMAARLRAAGGPASPADLGFGTDKLRRDYRRARLIRRRYTVLDLLDDLGLHEVAMAELFGPSGYWGREHAAPAARAAGRG
jgi:glycerol-1-phosphate dehydrogenase [NAD(P)+]